MGGFSDKDCRESSCEDLKGCGPSVEGMAVGVSPKSSANRIPGSNGAEYFDDMALIAEGSMSMMDTAQQIGLSDAQR